MKIFLYVVNVASALLMIGVILLQQGKGAEMGSGFGRGSSGSLFGPRGSANFLTRTTSVLATVFFLSAFMLTFLANKRPSEEIIRDLEQNPPPAAVEQAAPAAEEDSEPNAEKIPE